MSTSYTHAKDYLLEFLSSKGDQVPDWIHKLIHKVIENDGILSKEEKDSMFIDFITSRGVDIPDILDPTEVGTPIDYTEHYTPIDKRNILLQKLTHIKGVNALIENESITFSPNCTILFGMNGSGKSGYFKILNDLAGGASKREILGNIYNPGDGTKEVLVEYTKNGSLENPVIWNGDSGDGLFPEITVFDSEYLRKYIGARRSGVNPQPLGLHYFSVITKTIEDYGNFLEDSITALDIPDITGLKTLIQSQDLKGLLDIQTKPTPDNFERINELKEFGDEKLKELQDKEATLEKIKSSDIHIKLHQSKVKELSEFLENINKYELFFRVKYWKLHFAIKQFIIAKERQEIMEKSLSILNTIPHEGIGSWDDFIKSAETYKQECAQSNQSIREEICPYCHQEIISPNSKHLIQAYTKYLEDNSTKCVQERGKLLKKIKEELEKIQIIGLNTVPESDRIKDKNLQCYTTLSEIESHFKKLYKEFVSESKEGREIDEKIMISFRKERHYLKSILRELELEIKSLADSVTSKDTLIKEIHYLNDKKIISTNYALINSYYEFLVKKHKIEEIKKETSATKRSQISGISTKASEELGNTVVNETLATELASLHSGLSVSLVKVSNTGGIIELQPKILITKEKKDGTNEVEVSEWDASKVLSEGELKALGLAILLTNIIHQDSPCIILDDPVNSLDNGIIYNFSKRIIELSKKKQIIIFTHNAFFHKTLEESIRGADGFHLCGDIKNCSKVTECHAYSYHVRKDFTGASGKLFPRGSESLNTFLGDAKRKITTNSDSISSIASDLKRAIEYFIEEELLQSIGSISERNKGENMPWEKLNNIGFDKTIIDKLKTFWGDLSNRGTHTTSNSENNPLTLKELQDIVAYLTESKNK